MKTIKPCVSVLFVAACGGSSENGSTTTNKAPVLVAFVAPHARVQASVLFDFSGSYDSDGRIAEYRLVFSDGYPEIRTNQNKFTRTFAGAGIFSIVLSIVDDRGTVSAATVSIEIITDPDPVCSTSDECSGGDICSAGLCQIVRCAKDGDCAAGSQCAFGYCRLPDPCPADGGACPSGKRCVAYRCLPTVCRGGKDCEYSETCVGGVCEGL